jgi:hypothetical protein
MMLFAWFIVALIAVGSFQFITPMYWTLQNLKDSENKQRVLHYSSSQYLAPLRWEEGGRGGFLVMNTVAGIQRTSQAFP